MTTLLHLSDWHTNPIYFEKYIKNLLKDRHLSPDLVIMTGDMIKDIYSKDAVVARRQNRETEESVRQALHWKGIIKCLRDVLPGVDVIAVPGNHDFTDYDIPGMVVGFDDPAGFTYEWKGHVIHGFRGVPEHFQMYPDELNDRAFEVLFSNIDPRTDILITHAPPYGVLDDVHGPKARGTRVDWKYAVEERHIGILGLKEAIEKHEKIKVHCFGHVHEEGEQIVTHGKTTYSNASLGLNWIQLTD